MSKDKDIKFKLSNIDDEGIKKKLIADIENGLSSPFWQFIVEVLDANIKDTKDQLFNDEDLTKEENNLLKKYIKAFEQLKALPKRQLAFLKEEPIDEDEENYDPYDTEPPQE